MSDPHGHTSLENSSAAGIRDAGSMSSETEIFVKETVMVNGVATTVMKKKKVAAKDANFVATVKRQSQINVGQSSQKFDTTAWLNQIRSHVETNATTHSSRAYEDLKNEDTRLGNLGPMGVFPALTLNTFLDMLETLKGADLKDPDMYRHAEYQGLDLLRRIAASPQAISNYVAEHNLEAA